jgi:hypothetical protein
MVKKHFILLVFIIASLAVWAKKPNAYSVDKGFEIINYRTIEAHLSLLAEAFPG